jgi:hypothetical protein
VASRAGILSAYHEVILSLDNNIPKEQCSWGPAETVGVKARAFAEIPEDTPKKFLAIYRIDRRDYMYCTCIVVGRAAVINGDVPFPSIFATRTKPLFPDSITAFLGPIISQCWIKTISVRWKTVTKFHSILDMAHKGRPFFRIE